MIRAADIGYAVENATDEVKSAADRLTVDCKEHAIAAIIREIEESL
jgi:hydroxymethylpyrimidine pyrophosphatase-like HAD family hydrolase